MKSRNIPCKICRNKQVAQSYVLKNAEVNVCARCGLHYTNHLDDLDPDYTARVPANISPSRRNYISNSLQSNRERFHRHRDITASQFDTLEGCKILDVGCGGGLFLKLCRDAGADVTGLELDGERVFFASTEYGLKVMPHSVTNRDWTEQNTAGYDAVTLWDVIEHVNDPVGILSTCRQLLSVNGRLLLDTPNTEGLYHKLGKLTYRASFGRIPGLLDIMYSDHQFGHKQLFSRYTITAALKTAGFKKVHVRTLTELSFPVSYYVEKITGRKPSNWISTAIHTMTRSDLIRNKLVVVASK